MAKPEGVNSKIIRENLKKFPNIGIRTLATKLYKEYPLNWPNYEACRTSIKRITGKNGDVERNSLKDKSLVRGEYKINLPKSYAEDYTPYIVKNSNILILSDFHFPYQCNKSIEAAIRYGLDEDVNCIIINGDLFDFATISRHERSWHHREVHEEFEAVRSFLAELRRLFPNATIVFKEGNHDERWEKWLYLKAPEIFNDAEFKLVNRLRLAELNIDIVQDKRPIKIGKLVVLHGHELAGGSGGVNPARATFLKTLESVVVGHYHKSSQHTETSMLGNTYVVTSTGCLCGMNPSYMPINKWNNGFAHVKLNIKTGEYQLENLKIIKGKIFR